MPTSKSWGGGGNELRAKWNIEEDEKVITILSRLEKVKGHATLLKVLNQIPYKLLITGNDADDDSYRRELMELSQTYGLEKHLEFIDMLMLIKC